MRLSHARRAVSARFDDPNLLSCAGLVPVVGLAARCGLPELLSRRLSLSGPGTANAAAKVSALVFGMVAGADSISDMDLLRHGGMGRLFTGIRAPSTLGTLLRAFTFGHVRQLDAVAARLLARLVGATPLLPGRDKVCFVDIDDTIRQVYGHAKQGAGRGYTGVNGLNALLVTISTPSTAPVIAAARLRRGAAASPRGAASLLANALAGARRVGAGASDGLMLVRADSAFYSWAITDTARRAGARFSVTTRITPAIAAAIATIDETTWTPIRYRNAVFDDTERRWVSEAEVAEIEFTAFRSRRQDQQITARLIVRRVRRLHPAPTPGRDTRTALARAGAQQELFAAYRYHAIFTDSPEPMLAAEATHRDHAIVEQVIADLKNSALAHLPSGRFTANAAWLACAVIAHNLTRAAAAHAGTIHAKARTATLRAHLIAVPARIARSAHRLVLHLPRDWPWQAGLDELLRLALHDPLHTTS
jgi:hypothetical protein